MKRIILIAALGVLGGCVSAKPTIAPDGKAAFSVSCNGGTHDLGDCYQKAGEICPRGFDVIAGESGGQGFVGSSGGVIYGGTIQKRTIIVECKQS